MHLSDFILRQKNIKYFVISNNNIMARKLKITRNVYFWAKFIIPLVSSKTFYAKLDFGLKTANFW